MTVKSLTIPKEPPRETSLNFQELRRIGIDQLEKLGTKIWTDFNLHDPGITILEVLCYALTDLGYRTKFPIKDLLASKNKKEGKKDYFTPVEILPNCPVTQQDFRKIIIDTTVDMDNDPNFQREFKKKCNELPQEKSIRAIKNAWIEKASEVDPPLYLKASYKKNQAFEEQLEALIENILYRKLVYEQAVFEDLVSNMDTVENAIEKCKTALTGVNAPKIAPEYENIKDFKEAIKNVFDFLNLPLSRVEMSQLVALAFQGADISFTEDENTVGIEMQGLYEICVELSDEIDPLDEVMVNKVKQAISNRLHQYRNLCEDFLNIQEVKAQKMGFCAEVEISEDSDKEEILAEIIFRVQEFLTPSIKFHSLEELCDKGLSCDEIYNGPLLQNGFILNKELDAAPLRTAVNRSDLTQVMMDIEGVEAIRFLRIYKWNNDDIFKDDLDKWCVEIPQTPFKQKPVLDLAGVEVKFKIGSIFTIAETEKVNEKLSLKKELNNNHSFALTSGEKTIEKGRYRNLDTYHSIQNEFPMTYHIGREGLPSTANDQRKAQAKQLKGYLLFFDQLLVNYLAQLSQVKNLFSISQDIDSSSYFYQVLKEEQIPGINDLIDTNDYEEHLKEIIEDTATRRSRKNIMLDHLLARFGEKFSDYALWQFTATTTLTGEKRIVQSFDEMLQGKSAFLKALPLVGAERGKGYNCRLLDCGKPDVWNSTNVSGLKKRVSSLLGFSDFKRKTLTCPPEFDTVIQPIVEGGAIKSYGFKLINNRTKQILLLGGKDYKLPRNAKKAAKILYEMALEDKNYYYSYNNKYEQDPTNLAVKDNVVEIRLVIRNSNGNTVAQSKLLNISGAIALKKEILDLAYPADCGNEGFHVVEHLLLRPLQENVFKILQPFKLSEGCVIGDPYSFWLTIIIPKWQTRFTERNARDLFEQVVRRETPAHLGIRFLALKNEEMKDFEVIYKKWLEEKAKEKPNARESTKNTNDLVLFLNRFLEAEKTDSKTQRSKLNCEAKLSEKGP